MPRRCLRSNKRCAPPFLWALRIFSGAPRLIKKVFLTSWRTGRIFPAGAAFGKNAESCGFSPSATLFNFCPGEWDFPAQKTTCPDVHAVGHDESAKEFPPFCALLRGFDSLGRSEFSGRLFALRFAWRRSGEFAAMRQTAVARNGACGCGGGNAGKGRRRNLQSLWRRRARPGRRFFRPRKRRRYHAFQGLVKPPAKPAGIIARGTRRCVSKTLLSSPHLVYCT